MTDPKKEFIKALNSMTGRYSGYQIFSDWAEASAISIRNGCHPIQDDEWKRWEEQYAAVMAKYGDEERDKFAYMLACTAMALEKEMSDFLGEAFMEANLGEKGMGQFFTPFQVSLAVARLTVSPDALPAEGRMSMNEPSSGAGGMVIACCRRLHELGFDWQRRLDIVAQDLDWRAVYMTYIQLSLLGCRAIVVQGNTLTDPYHPGYDRARRLETPGKMGMLI